VRVGVHDRAGLDRLLPYCARPPFALERLELLDDECVVYRLPKPQRDDTTALSLPPLELIDHRAALIPPPRRHRHRYHGVLAPNSPLHSAAARCPLSGNFPGSLPAWSGTAKRPDLPFKSAWSAGCWKSGTVSGQAAIRLRDAASMNWMGNVRRRA
jgi:hypothetical protein